MVTRGAILLFFMLLPLGLFFQTNQDTLTLAKSCYIRSVLIREEPSQTVVGRAQWWISLPLDRGHGLFYGSMRYLTPDNQTKREVLVNRNLIFNTEVNNGLVDIETLSVSKISGDNVSNQDLERYFSAVLVPGHMEVRMMFTTRDGGIMSGLTNRPNTICDDSSVNTTFNSTNEG